jgi:two-component system, cell cycle response regulator DivK
VTNDVSATSTPAKVARKARPLTILVVDDVPETCRMYSGYFQFVGASVLTARDGIEALQVVYQYQPDAVVLDLAMPRMTGLEVLRNVRRDPRTRDLPIIALTGQATSETQEAALVAGADLYLTKPCLPHVVFNFVVQLLRRERRNPPKPV